MCLGQRTIEYFVVTAVSSPQPTRLFVWGCLMVKREEDWKKNIKDKCNNDCNDRVSGYRKKYENGTNLCLYGTQTHSHFQNIPSK